MKLSELAVGNLFTGNLGVKSCVVRNSSNTKKDYLELVLTDGETSIDARYWDHAGPVPEKNSIIFIKAETTQFKDKKQLKINEWKPADEKTDPQEFIPTGPFDGKALFSSITDIVGKEVKTQPLKDLLNAVFSNNNNEVYDKFLKAPAAKYHHHNYVYGLAEHTYGVLVNVLRMATEEEDRELLAVGAILHDIGKVVELDWSGLNTIYTDRGMMLGHISEGLMMINRLAQNIPDLQPARLTQLLHLVASHHGKLEWGSPVEPCTKEALLLHYADMLDVSIWKLKHAAANMTPGETRTPNVPGFKHPFLVK